MMRRLTVSVSSAVLLVAMASCDGSTTEPVAILVTFATPVSAVAGAVVHCAVFPVTIAERAGDAGSLSFLDTTISTATGAVLISNRRPNADFVFVNTTVPANGSLVADAGACWAPQPAGTALTVRVEVQVDPGARQSGFQGQLLAPAR